MDAVPARLHLDEVIAVAGQGLHQAAPHARRRAEAVDQHHVRTRAGGGDRDPIRPELRLRLRLREHAEQQSQTDQKLPPQHVCLPQCRSRTVYRHQSFGKRFAATK